VATVWLWLNYGTERRSQTQQLTTHHGSGVKTVSNELGCNPIEAPPSGHARPITYSSSIESRLAEKSEKRLAAKVGWFIYSAWKRAEIEQKW
jgi:hypothetical protein